MEIIISMFIAVIGWIVNHLFTLKAHKKSFYNQLQNEARISITSSLRQYLEWIESLKVTCADIIAEGMVGPHIVLNEDNEEVEIEPDFKPLFRAFREVAQKQNERLLFYYLLEEYEPLFPQTVEAREYVWNRHNLLQQEIFNVLAYLGNSYLDNYSFELIQKLENSLTAQVWFTRDFIVCIQNIALSRITNRVITEYKNNTENQYVRIKTDKKLKIIFSKPKLTE